MSAAYEVNWQWEALNKCPIAQYLLRCMYNAWTIIGIRKTTDCVNTNAARNMWLCLLQKFLARQNEYVPMIRKIITSIIWNREREKRQMNRSFTLISNTWLNKFDLLHAYLIARLCAIYTLPSFAINIESTLPFLNDASVCSWKGYSTVNRRKTCTF